MSNPRLLAGLTATAAIALVVGSCEANRNALAPKVGGPRFHFGAFECIPFKMTGGGRIDFPPGTADKNPPASHIFETFGAHVDTDCRDGAAHWGGKLRVQNTGQEDLDFEVWDCDNGEPGAGHDGFAISVPEIGYEVKCPDPSLPPAEPTCTLTGGNRQFHPTHL